MSKSFESPKTTSRQPSDESGPNPVDAIAESFLARLRAGEYPTVSEYLRRYPDCADELRSVLPTLAMLEKGAGGLSASPPFRESVDQLAQLGEYQIVSEIGRGGMGIVYEACHETMRRRVALKVLPAPAADDPIQLQRFYGETRIAGRLHHSNIVPVFEVGHDRGYHYYAMQFIQGQNLDSILKELRRIHHEAPPTQRLSRQSLAPRDDVSRTVAMRLQDGTEELDALSTEAFDRNSLRDPSHADASKCKENLTDIADPAHDLDEMGVLQSRRLPVYRQQAGSDQAVVAADPHTQSTQSVGQQDNYYHRVARIGLQLADALAYAHSHQILHRDIKPSNIILDVGGNAWLTDFGLAKDDHSDLTRSGDILGTFRYMAPERLEGQADQRSDIYGLGLTLYELCTLQNAFEATDRVHLIKEICERQPPRPKSIRGDVPRDLETIVLKAMEKQPNNRYRSARQLAEDLRLFLADHPIHARRVSVAERTWRWARRNPQLASLVLCVGLLIMIVVAGSLRFGYLTAQQSHALLASQQTATERLYDAFRQSAEAHRSSGRPGQRFKSLEDISNARELLPQLAWSASRLHNAIVDLRHAAVAGIALTDLRPVEDWGPVLKDSRQIGFNAQYSQVAQSQTDGSIVILDLATGNPLQQLPAPAPHARIVQAIFSPDSRYLAAAYIAQSRSLFRLWEITTAHATVELEFAQEVIAGFDFDGASSRLFVALHLSVEAFDVPTGQSLGRIQVAEPVRALCVHPKRSRAALLTGARRTVLCWSPGEAECEPWELPFSAWAMAWQPTALRLAIGGSEGELVLLGLEQMPPSQSDFVGHSSRVSRLYFSPQGNQLLSEAWDGTTRLWEVSSSQQLLRADHFSLCSTGFRLPDGKAIGRFNRGEWQLWEFPHNVPLRVLSNPSNAARRWSVDFHPSGRWLLSETDAGSEFWDVAQSQLVHFEPATLLADGSSKDAEFFPDGKSVLTSNADGVRIYPLKIEDEAEGVLALGSPRELHVRQSTWVSLDKGGSTIAFRDGVPGDRARLLTGVELADVTILGPHAGLDRVELSPNGRWVATSCWGGRGVRVWDAHSGSALTPDPLLSPAAKTNVAFSPDSQRLATSTPEALVVWDTGSWSSIVHVRRTARDEWPGPLAFSPNGEILAAASTRFELALFDATTGEELAILAGPGNSGLHDCSFSPDGQLLAAASDRSIQLWDLTQLQSQLASLGLEFASRTHPLNPRNTAPR